MRGEVDLTDQEKSGRDLFFSDVVSCGRCHLQSRKQDSTEVFSNARYYNLGVPANTNVRALNGKGAAFIDRGLAEAPSFAGQALATGRFRVPTLRNVAVTGPYMHNGAFQELRTAVLFHDRFKAAAGTNPETSAPWGPAEVDANLTTIDLGETALTEPQLSAIIAFLATLTDKRNEHLLPQP